MEHNDFKRCDIKEKFLNPKITRRFLFLFTFTFQKKKEQQKYNSQQRMIFFVENRLGRAFEKSVLRAFQKSVCILISVYRKESKRIQNFQEVFRTFWNFPEFSVTFQIVLDFFGLFPKNRNQYQNALLKHSKTLFFQIKRSSNKTKTNRHYEICKVNQSLH